MQYTKLNWRNGQPYSKIFDDIYYSSDDAAQDVRAQDDKAQDASESIAGEAEFKHVFFNNNGLPERWSGVQEFVITELGFGSGLNCLLTIRQWLNHLEEEKARTSSQPTQQRCLHYIAVEKYPLSPDAIRALISRYPVLVNYCEELLSSYPPAIQGSHSRLLFGNRVIIHYKFMDAYEALKDEYFNVDAWYLDGFSPAKNADMWSLPLFEKIAQNSHDNTTCSTYTAAGFVKRNFQSAGFEINKVPGFGKKRDMLIAEKGRDPETSTHQQLESQQKTFSFADKPWYTAAVKPEHLKRCATIIGAGIAGLSVAYSLVKRGWSVTVIDTYGEPAKATSSNPAAIVYPRLSVNNIVDTQFNAQAYLYAQYVLNVLQDKYQLKFWFNNGLLQSIDEKRFSDIIKRHDFNQDFVDHKRNAGEHKQLYVEFKTAGVVLPQVLCDALVSECGDQLNIIKGTINNLKHTDNLWQCFADDSLVDESEVLIIANGTELNNISPEISFPVESVRGQAVVLAEQERSQDIDQAVNAGVYITPLINNRHYLGASYSRGNDDTEIDEHEIDVLLAELNCIYPEAFTHEAVETVWVGFRAMSKDRVPIVGAVADTLFFQREYADIKHGKQAMKYRAAKHLNGLYISAAHGSRGFTTCFLCAELIASQIEDSPLPVSKSIVDYLNPSRFIVNDLKRG
jgi:tRNA 5-methylaminomethyl-2-thiouridine biosynthesis bifunctional protein